MYTPILPLFSFEAWAPGIHPGSQFPLFLGVLNLLRWQSYNETMGAKCSTQTQRVIPTSPPSRFSCYHIPEGPYSKVPADLRDLHWSQEKVSVPSPGHYSTSWCLSLPYLSQPPCQQNFPSPWTLCPYVHFLAQGPGFSLSACHKLPPK